MNDNNNNIERRGLSFLSILTLIFVVAKIFGLLTWPWWLVLIPAFIPLIIAVVILLIIAIVSMFIGGDDD